VDEQKEETRAEEVSPTEDLMREHGVLKRVLLIYRGAIGQSTPSGRFHGSSQRFGNPDPKVIEDYHGSSKRTISSRGFRKARNLVRTRPLGHVAGFFAS